MAAPEAVPVILTHGLGKVYSAGTLGPWPPPRK